MSKTVLINPVIVINSVDLSDHITSVTIDESYDNVDCTGFGSGSKQYMAGLGDHKISLDFQQDFDSASVEATIGPLVGTTTNVTIHPVGTTSSTTNPSYSCTVLVDAWDPIDGKIGDLLTSSVSWPVSGDITKATS